MAKTKKSISLALSYNVIEAATKYAKAIDRSFSWCINELSKQGLQDINYLKDESDHEKV